jgi:hypothetical protein
MGIVNFQALIMSRHRGSPNTYPQVIASPGYRLAALPLGDGGVSANITMEGPILCTSEIVSVAQRLD